MPRTTKAVTAKARHKKVLNATKGHYGARSRLIKLLNNPISNHCNMHLEIERIRNGFSDPFGFLESQQGLVRWA